MESNVPYNIKLVELTRRSQRFKDRTIIIILFILIVASRFIEGGIAFQLRAITSIHCSVRVVSELLWLLNFYRLNKLLLLFVDGEEIVLEEVEAN